MSHHESMPDEVLTAMSDDELISLLQTIIGPIVVELTKRGLVDVHISRPEAFGGNVQDAVKVLLMPH